MYNSTASSDASGIEPLVVWYSSAIETDNYWTFVALIVFIAVCVVTLLVSIVVLSVKLYRATSKLRRTQRKWAVPKDNPYQWSSMTSSLHGRPWITEQRGPIFKPVAQAIMHQLKGMKGAKKETQILAHV